MANFERGAVGGAGFNDATYSLTLPLNNRRAVALYGGGPGGVKLNVGADNPSLIRIFERDKDRGGAALLASRREFWIDGIASGSTTLFARLPGGGDYSKALPVTVTASTDKDTLTDAFSKSRDALRRSIDALRDLTVALLSSQLNPPSTRIFTHSDALNAQQKKVMTAASKWLNLPDYNRSQPPTEYKMWVAQCP
jgi:hypothetical protein